MIQRGTTTHFVVSYDEQLAVNGIDAIPLADAELARCEADYATLVSWFAVTPPAANLPIHVNLMWAGGVGGGNNNGVSTINCNITATSDDFNVNELAVAELAEIFMTVQGTGWVAAYSHGEALSRVVASVLYETIDPTAHLRWAVASSWMNSTAPQRPDWVSATDPTDGNSISYGCGSLFLWYLKDQLNFPWPSIIRAAASTLEGVASNLGLQNAFADFIALIDRHYPLGTNVYFSNDDIFPLPDPALYLRDNLTDDGTTHSGPLSMSPDIIVRNAVVADPQTTFSTAASIANDMESDPTVGVGHTNYVYVRVWNRGTDGTNVTANVYWSPPSTLVSPNLWTPVGTVNFPDVPPGSGVTVSSPGISWSSVPATGHYCFVATVGNATDPAPTPSTFPDFDHFMNYVYAYRGVTWRNFDTGVVVSAHALEFRFQFLIPGAWDRTRHFEIETLADLPAKSRFALEVPHWFAHALAPRRKHFEELEITHEDPRERKRARIALPAAGPHALGRLALEKGVHATSHLAVHLPSHDLAPRSRPRDLPVRAPAPAQARLACQGRAPGPKIAPPCACAT
jgi:hypothetical protein